jgi:hypothetical protein
VNAHIHPVVETISGVAFAVSGVIGDQVIHVTQGAAGLTGP